MTWLQVILTIAVAVNGGGGVTKNSGVSQFWTDDYKVFEQVYGKTSDKKLYGATLPPSLSFGVGLEPLKLKQIQANEKIEKLHYNDEDISASGTQLDLGYNTNSYTDYIKLLAKQHLLKDLEKEIVTPTKSTYKFIGYSGDFKPISQSSDPETYSYFKHLEDLEKQQSIGFPQEGTAGFKPYGYGVSSPEDSDAYKSIQDILDAQGAANAKQRSKIHKVKDEYKYVTHGSARTKKPARAYGSEQAQGQPTRCVPGNSGRCRKRSSSPVRYYPRPVVRKIKHTIVSSDD